MQNTRLTTFVDRGAQRVDRWLSNPWRRVSVLIIGLLAGNFLGTAISTIAGQRAELDIVVAAILLGITEVVNVLVYRHWRDRPFPLQLLNMVKVGMIYSLFVDALKLGS